ncbi:SGNH/GDSL hydrolase family protein [Kitasatospora sp. NBC_01266]|uniref:SGNH/GDSL hydrolase family protein n=1 Tax=Kitasatospora sp. NBC_01266 TaxID=2903572 RepID=UPI002E30498F|nr:SGNH/GDSL hydrolase family protein [Kitasatospora sp. NBC_01266]
MSGFRLPATVRASLATATALTAALSVFTPVSAARAADAGPPNYVALGDSYSANVFVRPWNPGDGCGRSYRDYPHQVAEGLGLNLVDATCGAAEVQDGILGPQPASKLYGPPSVPPAGGWADRPAQIERLHADTDYVSVGIGGNTLGFGDIVTQCLERGLNTLGFGTPCKNYYTTGEGRDWLAGKFAQLDDEFGQMMTAIRDRAPNAKVAVVGYPAIVPDNSGCSWNVWRQLGTIAKGDMPWLDGVERQLNALIAQQADDNGATYVDTYGPSVDHGVCAAEGPQKWMYGVRDDLTGQGDQTDPPSALCSQIPGNGEACTFVHPNAYGADSQARQVQDAFEQFRTSAAAAGSS